MKNSFMIFLAVLLGTTLWAQPTLTESAILPIGTSLYGVFHKGPLSIDNNGPDQTWNIPDNPSTETFNSNLTILDPSNAPFSNLFPEATLTILNEDLYTYSHYKIENNQLISLGFDLGDDSFGLTYTTFEQGEAVVKWPMNFQDEWNNETMFEQFISGNKINMGLRTSTASIVGYGTVITPLGTYDNVLKMEVNVSNTGNDVDQIFFFHPSSMIPLVSATLLSDGIYEYNYLNLEGLSTSTGFIETVKKTRAQYTNGQIEVVHSSNQVVNEVVLTNNTAVSVPVSTIDIFDDKHILHINQPLSTGIYFVTLQYTNRKETVKVFIP
ncbi:MAG: hypothetical protein P1U56_25440 [Saprospiraceae bacterium]|nr:hypothetical protein [Saprospiraceae bacterium]